MQSFVGTLESLGLHRRFAVDVLSVIRGVRQVGLLHAPIAAESDLCDSLNGIGLKVFARRSLIRSDDPNSREAVLNDCSEKTEANFVELWYALASGNDLPIPYDLFANPGRYLGYPTCCVAEWEKLQSQRDFYSRYLFETSSGLWEVNRLSAVFDGGLVFPDFYPCSLECEAARAFVVPILEAARETLDRAWVEQTIKWMRAPVVIHGGGLYAFPNWCLSGIDLELDTLSAVRLPLCTLGRFERPADDPTRLVPFRYLAGAGRVVLVSVDGVRTELINLRQKEGDR